MALAEDKSFQVDDEDARQRVQLRLLRHVPLLPTMVARQQLRIRQHLLLEELGEAGVKGDPVQVLGPRPLPDRPYYVLDAERAICGPAAERALLIRLVTERERQDHLRIVLVLRRVTTAARDAVADDEAEHVRDYRTVSLLQSLLARLEVLLLVGSGLVKVYQFIVEGLVELWRSVDILVHAQKQAGEELVHVLLLMRLKLREHV